MNKQVVKRHNQAVLLVHRAVSQGSLAVVLATCDACPAADLPVGVHATRPPAWLVPCPPPPPGARARSWRPDLLYVSAPANPTAADDAALQALRQSVTSGLVEPPPAALARMRAAFTVHVVELGFLSESGSGWQEALERKRAQQGPLVAALEAAGWAHVRSRVVPLGSAGTVFTDAADSLSALGVPAHSARGVMRSLHFLAARAATALLSSRYALVRASRSSSRPLPPEPP